MVKMHVSNVSIDPTSKRPMVVLATDNEEIVLPIIVGHLEAVAISAILNGDVLPRPLTHDLLFTVINNLEATVLSAEIVDIVENIFYALLVVKASNGKTLRFDCRSSDAIAIALRADVAINVHKKVLQIVEEYESTFHDSNNLAEVAPTHFESKIPTFANYADLLQAMDPITKRKM